MFNVFLFFVHFHFYIDKSSPRIENHLFTILVSLVGSLSKHNLAIRPPLHFERCVHGIRSFCSLLAHPLARALVAVVAECIRTHTLISICLLPLNVFLLPVFWARAYAEFTRWQKFMAPYTSTFAFWKLHITAPMRAHKHTHTHSTFVTKMYNNEHSFRALIQLYFMLKNQHTNQYMVRVKRETKTKPERWKKKNRNLSNHKNKVCKQYAVCMVLVAYIFYYVIENWTLYFGCIYCYKINVMLFSWASSIVKCFHLPRFVCRLLLLFSFWHCLLINLHWKLNIY